VGVVFPGKEFVITHGSHHVFRPNPSDEILNLAGKVQCGAQHKVFPEFEKAKVGEQSLLALL